MLANRQMMGGEVKADEDEKLGGASEALPAHYTRGHLDSHLVGSLGGRNVVRRHVCEVVLDTLHAVAHVHLVAVGEAVVVAVGAEVGLVLDVLEDPEEGGSEGGTAQRGNPVDPVVAGEVVVDDGGAERTGRVERATGVVDGEHLADEESESDTDRRDEGGTVLEAGKEENGRDKHEGHEELDEEATRDGSTTAESGLSEQRAGSKDIGESSAGKATDELRDEEQETADRGDGTDEDKGSGDSRVEETSGNAEEHPDGSSKGSSEHGGDVEPDRRQHVCTDRKTEDAWSGMRQRRRRKATDGGG